MPRLAWVLLVLAVLLTAMVAGMLIAGSQVHRTLSAVLPPIGQTYACPPGSTPNEPGPADQARPPQDVPVVMAFNRRAGRLVALAGVDDAVDTWAFDVCTNTWTQMHPNREPFGWVRLVYDVGSDLMIGVADCRDCVREPTGTVWTYDLVANSWNMAGTAPTGVTNLFHDPISGLVVALGDEGGPYAPLKELRTYDVDTGTWTPIHMANALNTRVFAYDASVDRIIGYPDANPDTWLYDFRTGRSWRSGAITPQIGGSGMWGAPPAIAYDEAAERTMVFGNAMAAYDATADHWEVVLDDAGRDPSDWLPSSMVYDPVNRRLVGLGRGIIVDEGGVMGFDLVSREWTVLLEAQ
jgi:hypothetical protein